MRKVSRSNGTEGGLCQRRVSEVALSATPAAEVHCRRRRASKEHPLRGEIDHSVGVTVDDSVRPLLHVERSTLSDESEPSPESQRITTCASHGWVSLIGRRREMEDAVTAEPAFFGGGEYDFYAVYDGHGGASVAAACREEDALGVGGGGCGGRGGRGRGSRWRKAMEASFARLDGEFSAVVAEQFVKAADKTVGSTAVAVGSAEDLSHELRL
ncbi:hypothetical protein HPP92_026222 [Vanilla planifolia]|uniref:protein-serine/threonine phosphatase n=1 Tax=Vanilla planifolia TaxID=51239 RepID=A0A835PGI3_VANPL|nr:hypothetical protein HPP92_026402 [Vanilla planifolia]KAG0451529.1 hypothetical protein HPP92_026222 [Vanilla planifolia]